ncbi:MAG: proton-conducting transporter membrane subunit [Chryseolinea sp.]
MHTDLITLITLLSPAAFAVTAVISWFQPGLRPHMVSKMAMGSSFIAIISAAISVFFVYQYGLMQSSLIGINELGLSLRFDSLSIVMFSMIAIIGLVVIKFSLNYLDGDERQGRFIGRLAATITSVQLLVLAGNLGLLLISWVLTSISLHRLLLFYADRTGAVIAAKKKFIAARLADVCLLLSVSILYVQFGTGNLEVIFKEVEIILTSGNIPNTIEAAALLLAFAALLKSAQFPTHGWLIEVMETPTPVSALLHAGLLNAGPFLIIRMAFVMEASTYASILILLIGGFTALLASVAFLTQTSIKTALGYSSVAHMGFSLTVCGLGAYPVAMLHLVAHSFYKAHAFLSSGSIIDVFRGSKGKQLKRTGSPLKIGLGIVLAIGFFVGVANVWGIDPLKELPLLFIGGIIVMGLASLFTSALDSIGGIALFLRATALATLVATAFFTLESGASRLLAAQLPEMSKLNSVEIILMVVLLLAFGAVAFVQMLAPVLKNKLAFRALAVHLRNGFYANAVFDRMIGALRINSLKRF